MQATQVKVVDNYSAANGTSLQGYVRTTYAHLVALFGEPMGPGDKTTAEWILEFDDGTVATIYDWKELETPMDVYNWHVGGKRGAMVVAMVQEALDGYIEVVDDFYDEMGDEEVEYFGA
jgi:predicted dehydrogenase